MKVHKRHFVTTRLAAWMLGICLALPSLILGITSSSVNAAEAKELYPVKNQSIS